MCEQRGKGETGICRGEIRCASMDESAEGATKPRVVLKERQKKGGETKGEKG